MSGAKLFSGLLLLLLAVLLVYFFISYDFYVYDAEVVGAAHLSLQEVFEASGVNEMSAFYIRPAVVEARLEELPWVKEAHMRCEFPNRVRIILQGRQVAFVWQWGDRWWGIGGEGVLLPLSQVPEDVLWVEDHRPQLTEEGPSQELIASVLAVKEALPEVSRLTYDPTYGLTFHSAHGYAVRLGQGQMVRKAVIWRALEAELAARGIQPGYVDLRFPSSPCYGEAGS
jgi:cell division septal protein FtsQ